MIRLLYLLQWIGFKLNPESKKDFLDNKKVFKENNKTLADELGIADNYSIMNNKITINSIYGDIFTESFIIKFNIAKNETMCEGNINYRYSPLIKKEITISFNKATELKLFDNLIKLLNKYE